MTPTKQTTHSGEREADGIVAGEEETAPLRPKRGTKPIDRLSSEAQAPEPPKPQVRPVKAPSAS